MDQSPARRIVLDRLRGVSLADIQVRCLVDDKILDRNGIHQPLRLGRIVFHGRHDGLGPRIKIRQVRRRGGDDVARDELPP